MWVGGSSSFHKRNIDVSVSFFLGSLFITTGVAPSHFIFSRLSRVFLSGCKWPTMHLATIQICDIGMMAIETAKRIGSDVSEADRKCVPEYIPRTFQCVRSKLYRWSINCKRSFIQISFSIYSLVSGSLY